MKIEMYKKEYEVSLLITSYSNNGNMAIELVENDGEPFMMLTTNLDFLMPCYAFVEDNKMHKDFIEKYKLGKQTGATRNSGFNTYLLYEFDMDILSKYMNKDSDYWCLEEV